MQYCVFAQVQTTKDVKQLSEPPSTPTVLTFLLPDLASKSNLPIGHLCQELSHCALRSCTSFVPRHSSAVCSASTFKMRCWMLDYLFSWTVSVCPGDIKKAKAIGFQGCDVEDTIDEGGGVYHAVACGRNDRPLGCLISILSLYILHTQ